jgi:phenylacetate-CoA ligase
MFQVRGENVYPSEIGSVLVGLADYGGEHRIVISREGTMDELLVQVEPTEVVQAAGQAALAAFGQRIERELNKVLGLRARVELVSPRSFPRTDFKARRVIDDRDLFRSLRGKLDG